MQILELVTFASLTLFIGFYVFYFAICIRYKRTKHLEAPIAHPSGSLPVVSMIIPTYNEAKIILSKVENLKSINYPRDKFQIVFVDSGSPDGTAGLIEEIARESDLPVTVVQQGQRKGFNKAVIDGFAETSGEIICITGAETEYDPKALHVMVEKFYDPKVGAVTGRQKIKNIDEGYSPKLEAAYRSMYDLIREGESVIDSPFDIKGEISAARRDIVAHLVNKPELSGKGCIDCCISFQAKMDGYRAVYEPRAVYHELSPGAIRDSFKQQIRRAATLIENMMAFKSMLLNSKFGSFGVLIMPAHFLMLIILPFVLLTGMFGIVALLILDLSDYLLLAFVGVSFLAIVLSSQLQAFMKTQIVLIIAALKILTGVETQKFERLSTTRR